MRLILLYVCVCVCLFLLSHCSFYLSHFGLLVVFLCSSANTCFIFSGLGFICPNVQHFVVVVLYMR